MEWIALLVAFIAGLALGCLIGTQRERRSHVDLMLHDMGTDLKTWRSSRKPYED